MNYRGKNSSLEVMDTKREREVAVKAHARYIAELTEQQNFNERAQLALNAFEVNVYFFFALQRSDLTLPARTSTDDPLVSGNVKQDFDKQKYPLVYFCDDPLVSSKSVSLHLSKSICWFALVIIRWFWMKLDLGRKSAAVSRFWSEVAEEEASTKDMNLSANHHKRGIEEKESTENDADNNENLPSRNNNENSSSETASKRLIDGDVFMNSSESELSRFVALMFNNLYYGIPEVAPSKLSEEEHCDMFIYPIARSFRRNDKKYELKLNRANFKPLSCTPLQEKMDRLKVQLKARKSINQQLQRKGGPGEAVMFLSIGNSMESFFMDLKCDGLYRSWPFLTTKLVVDKSTIPLAEFAISHLMAFEERVEKIAKILNTEVVNSRPSTTVLHTRISGYTTSKNDVQIRFMRSNVKNFGLK
ncbi:15001_t:CDS:10 [Gigaspora margarita]|uniref:15001_t:CDS:1 n=1 Tax=Gigaspora margarita TaxID=4874 RepID=A0ABN7V1Y6_GIGMA|nr:15001_t:CDS:10 [Gigaspora margarita]